MKKTLRTLLAAAIFALPLMATDGIEMLFDLVTDEPAGDMVHPAYALGIADEYARNQFGEDVAGGEPIPLANKDSQLIAYAVPFVIGGSAFPDRVELFGLIDELYMELGIDPLETETFALPRAFNNTLSEVYGGFATVYVGATYNAPPVLGSTRTLHPYYEVGILALERSRQELGEASQLRRIHFVAPGMEYLSFEADERTTLVHQATPEPMDPDAVLLNDDIQVLGPDTRTAISRLWAQLHQEAPKSYCNSTLDGEISKEIDLKELIPVVDWTYWCVPTALTMVVGYWDNYQRATGKITGLGNLFNYWVNNGKTNVPDFIHQLVDPSTGSWRRQPNGQPYPSISNFVSDRYGYSLNYAQTAVDAQSDFGWMLIKDEVQRGRPMLWGSDPRVHACTAFGYRQNYAGKFVILYTTWGSTAARQRQEWSHTLGSDIGQMIPGLQSCVNDLALDFPRGGDSIAVGAPVPIMFFVWGTAITDASIEYSTDDGRSWYNVTASVPTHPGWNLFHWTPTSSGPYRLRIKGYNSSGVKIAGDGAQTNFMVP